MAPFALLDDSGGLARLYTGYLGVLEGGADDVPELFTKLQSALAQGSHAVGVFPYELGAALQNIAPHATVNGAAQIMLFAHCERLSPEQVEAWLADRAGSAPAGIACVRASVDKAQFNACIERIHDWISAGDTYQINYTYRLRFDSFGEIHALYRRLRERQPVPYGALIALPDGQAILSLSPELFVRHKAGELVVRPMKGTAPAGDADAARALAADPKNRAENLMIVDLLRNDLGRVAVNGSVEVPQLFWVAQFGEVLQMTSTVRAQLRPEVDLCAAFVALFPCGSITGAPKRRSMQIIRELEPDPRGVYTGAIGWFEPPAAGQRIGDFCLSVAIRTLALGTPEASGVRHGEMGIGAGIVHDSVAADEFAECALKAKFLTGLPNDFALLETMVATRADGVRHLGRHLQRLQTSATFFGFHFDLDAARRAIEGIQLSQVGPQRVRLALRQSGELELQCASLAPLSEPFRLLVGAQTTQADDLFLRHKTTLRERYDEGWRAAEAQGAFDMLFCNQRGEVTEGGRSNVFVKIDGRWCTPPLNAGVLPGVMRAVLLEDPAWNAIERSLTLDDLRKAQEIVLCNALRGVMPVSLLWI
jgi:para-aminobenzoate synthetase/4-amino-4-deoxychorismate lyase